MDESPARQRAESVICEGGGMGRPACPAGPAWKPGYGVRWAAQQRCITPALPALHLSDRCTRSCWRCGRWCGCWTRRCTRTWRPTTASPSSSATDGCSSCSSGSCPLRRWAGSWQGPLRATDRCPLWARQGPRPLAVQAQHAMRGLPAASMLLAQASGRLPNPAGAAPVGGAVGGAARPAPLPLRRGAGAPPPPHTQVRTLPACLHVRVCQGQARASPPQDAALGTSPRSVSTLVPRSFTHTQRGLGL